MVPLVETLATGSRPEKSNYQETRLNYSTLRHPLNGTLLTEDQAGVHSVSVAITLEVERPHPASWPGVAEASASWPEWLHNHHREIGSSKGGVFLKPIPEHR